MRVNKEKEFDIVDIEFPGLGIAYNENKKIYIKGAVPGQKVLAVIAKSKRNMPLQN